MSEQQKTEESEKPVKMPDLSTAKKQNNGRPELPITIREADQADVSFIFSSWLKSFSMGALARFVAKPIYYSEQHKLIERLLQSCNVLVACDPNDIGEIYGYVVYENIEGINCFHYAYTKHPFRALGVFNQLLNHIGQDFKNTSGLYTHENKLSPIIARRKNLIYHPYILVNWGRKNG